MPTLADLTAAARKYSGTDRFFEIADKASNSSREAFPGQDWDNSQRNAARHSIWTALMANQLGGGPIARGVAKGVGYLNEGIGLVNASNLTKAGSEDMRHDLNNNAVGLNTLATMRDTNPAVTDDQIIETLLRKAREAKFGPAPPALAPAESRLTSAPQGTLNQLAITPRQ
jgi:hypothetical protein